MGSRLGSLLADCFMASLENNQLKTTFGSLHLYEKYMDDVYIICDNKYYLKHLPQTLITVIHQ